MTLSFPILWQDLNNKDPEQFPKPEVHGMLEFDWDMFIESKRKVKE